RCHTSWPLPLPYTTLFRSILRAYAGVEDVTASDHTIPDPLAGPDQAQVLYEMAAIQLEHVARRLPTGSQIPSWAADAEEELIERSEEHTSELQSRENLVCR